MSSHRAATALLCLAMLLASSILFVRCAPADGVPTSTAEGPYERDMVDGVGGWRAAALFTVGETVNGYTPVGIPDGLGAFRLDDQTVRVLLNHELRSTQGYVYDVSDGAGGSFSLRGARISYFDVERDTRAVVDAGLAFSHVRDAQGNVATGASFLPDNRTGFARFCSSNLVPSRQFDARRGLENRLYFAGEESGGSGDPVGGGEWALDPLTGHLWHVPALGRGAWENVTEVDTGTTTHVAFILADDTAPFDADGDGQKEAAPLFLYVGEKEPAGDFLARNGLRGGALYVWVSDTGELTPLDFNSAGTLNGAWVQVDNTARPDQGSEDGSTGYDEWGYPTQRTLWSAAEAAGAFGFSRPEDVSTNPADGRQVVLASTGVDDYAVDPDTGNGADTFGTVYTVQVDFTAVDTPTGSLTILYDGDVDPTRALRSPDNLAWSGDGHIYVQEDEAEEDTLSGDEVLFGPGAANPHEAGIVRINSTTGSVTRVANIDREVVLDPTVDPETAAVDLHAGNAGEWESSGIIDVSSLFDRSPGTLFLFTVMAHGIANQDTFNPLSRITNDDLVQGGQLLWLHAPAALHLPYVTAP